MRDSQRILEQSTPTNADDDRRPQTWMIAAIYLGLAITTLLIYSQVHQFEFVNWDDDSFVHQNPQVVSGLNADNFQWSLEIHGPGQWHPMAWWAHQLNCQMFGVQPGAHHMVNVALHVTVTLVLLTVLWRISGAFWPSALVASLHALHPLSVESIAWVAHLREPLSLLFWLLVMWAYTAYSRHGGAARYLLVVLLFALGLMAKPTLITLPFVLLLLDWWQLNRIRLGTNLSPENKNAKPAYRSLGKLVLEKVPLLALSLVSVYLAYLCQRSMDAVISLENHSWGARMANASQSYVLYLRNMVWPMNLTTLYPLPDEFSSLYVVGSLLLLIGITGTAIYFRGRAPHLIVGWLWYLGTLVPVIGILKMGAMTAMTDHYMYVSLLGIYIAIAWQLSTWVEQNPKLKYFACGIVALTLLTLATLSSKQIATWRNSETLWKHALAVGQESEIAHNNLGEALMQSNQFNEALEHYTEATRIAPDYFEAHSNAGRAFLKLGRTAEALASYRTALSIAPDNAIVNYNCGIAFQKQKRWADALKHYEESLRIKPDFATAHAKSGVSLQALGRTEEAIKHYQRATDIAPDFFTVYNKHGVALRSLGRNEEAIGQFENALRVQPDYFDANYNAGISLKAVGRRAKALERFEMAIKIEPNDGGAQYGVAWILSTAPEQELRDGKRAIKHARLAVGLIKNNAFMLDALAAAHAEAGEFTEAVKWSEQAVQLATGNNKTAFESRLARYKQQRPYRQSK